MSLNTLKFHILNWHRPFFRSLRIIIVIIRPDVWLNVYLLVVRHFAMVYFYFLFSIAQFFTFEYPHLWPLSIYLTHFFRDFLLFFLKWQKFTVWVYLLRFISFSFSIVPVQSISHFVTIVLCVINLKIFYISKAFFYLNRSNQNE